MLNDIGYQGPLSVEWEDSRMDREHGATESCAYVKKLNFKPQLLYAKKIMLRNLNRHKRIETLAGRTMLD